MNIIDIIESDSFRTEIYNCISCCKEEYYEDNILITTYDENRATDLVIKEIKNQLNHKHTNQQTNR